MHDWITQVGAGGAFILIALKMLLDYSSSKKKSGDDPETAAMGQRLISIESRMGTNESGLHRSVGIMEQVINRLDRLEERIWNSRDI